MTRHEHRRFEELLDRQFEQLRELWGACEDKTHIKCVADRLLSRLLQRLNQEIPYLSTAEGAREALHVRFHPATGMSIGTLRIVRAPAKFDQ